jgi:hypothetical protein
MFQLPNSAQEIFKIFETPEEGLDQVKKAMEDSLDKLKKSPGLGDLAGQLYKEAEEGLVKDMEEIGAGEKTIQEAKRTFQTAWQEQMQGRITAEALESPERLEIDAFIAHVENLPKLQEIMASHEPQAKWQTFLKGIFGKNPYLIEAVGMFSPTLKTFLDGVLGNKPAEGAKAEAGQEEQDGQTEEEAEKSEGEAKSQSETQDADNAETGEQTESDIPPAPEKVETNRERSERILEDIAKNYHPKFTPLVVKAGGHTLKFKVSTRPYNKPMDGPTSVAAAQMLDCTIPTVWLAKKMYEAKSAKKMNMVAAPEIARRHGMDWDNENPDGKWMMSDEFTETRNQILDEQSKDVPEDQLLVGQGKMVTHPTDQTGSGNLCFYGGQKPSGGLYQRGGGEGMHEASYYDYSHMTYFVSNEVIVDGQKKRMDEVMKDPDLASLIGYSRTYPQPSWMQDFVTSHRKSTPIS